MDGGQNQVMNRHQERIKFLQEKIQEQGWCAAILFYSRDVFYYTGTAQPSFFVVFPDNYFLFVRSGIEFALIQASLAEESIIAERRLGNIYHELFSGLKTKGKIGIELDMLVVTQFVEFREIFKGYEFVNVSPIVLEQRKKKDAEEVRKIRQACEAVDMGHKALVANLREGKTELELAAVIENAHRLAGHEGIFFIRQPDFFMSRGPISSGPNLFKISGVVYSITGVGLSPSVPAGPTYRPVENGDLVIVDIPTLVEGYHADQARSYYLGQASQQVKTLYQKLKEIADYLIEEISLGMKCHEIFQLAMEKSKKLKTDGAFLSFGRGRKSHMIGHGVGLEVNEPPIISANNHAEVSAGFVIALDMHMLDEKVGVVKLEDMILLTESGNEILTKSPRNLIEL